MKKTILLALCVLYCPPVLANEISELKEQIATLQEQTAALQEQTARQQEMIQILQQQVQSPVGENRERSVIEDHSKTAARYDKREPRVNVSLKPGYIFLRRETPPSNYSDGRVGGGGPGLSAEIDTRVTRRTTFNLTFDGILDRVGGKQTGLDGRISQYYSQPNWNSETTIRSSRELTDRTRLLVGGPNLRYKVLSGEKATLDFSMGFEVLNLQFRSMDKSITPPYTSYAHFNINNVDGWTKTVHKEQVSATRTKEKYFGYGPRFGLAAGFKPTERLGFSAEGFYTTFLDLSGSKERTTSGGTNFPTEGHAFRFDLGTSYEIRRSLRLGAGYRGYLLSIDQSKTKNVNSGSQSMGAEDIRTDLFYGYIGVDF